MASCIESILVVSDWLASSESARWAAMVSRRVESALVMESASVVFRDNFRCAKGVSLAATTKMATHKRSAMTDLVLNFNECYLLQFRLKQPFHLTEPCQGVASKLCEALLCLLYVFFAVEMSFREELVGVAYKLLLNGLWLQVVMG